MTIADIAATVSAGPLPFRFTAFDGSSAGPRTPPDCRSTTGGR